MKIFMTTSLVDNPNHPLRIASTRGYNIEFHQQDTYNTPALYCLQDQKIPNG
jgi:phosphoserine aminotransferase